MNNGRKSELRSEMERDSFFFSLIFAEERVVCVDCSTCACRVQGHVPMCAGRPEDDSVPCSVTLALVPGHWVPH